jgi:hypothetical protein
LDSDAKQALEIMRMPEDQRQQAFAKLSPNKQVDVYLAGRMRVEPPLLSQFYLASNWRSVLPVVKDRLTTESDGRLASLMPVLVAISNNYCSFAERKDVTSLVSQAIPRMGRLYQESAEEDLKKISRPNKELPPCQ